MLGGPSVSRNAARAPSSLNRLAVDGPSNPATKAFIGLLGKFFRTAASVWNFAIAFSPGVTPG